MMIKKIICTDGLAVGLKYDIEKRKIFVGGKTITSDLIDFILEVIEIFITPSGFTQSSRKGYIRYTANVKRNQFRLLVREIKENGLMVESYTKLTGVM